MSILGLSEFVDASLWWCIHSKVTGLFCVIRSSKKDVFLSPISVIDSWHFVKSVKKYLSRDKIGKGEKFVTTLFKSDLRQAKKASKILENGSII